MSFGPNLEESCIRAAALANAIFKGAKPADLPVEEPTRFTLAVNLKTAAALGIVIPPAILVRADKVIEKGAVLLRLLKAACGTQRHSARNDRLGPFLGVERE